MERFVIIVAGGSGQRMGTDTPKQFLTITGRPLLMLTMETFYRFDAGIHLVLVLPSKQINLWENLCKKHNFMIPHQRVTGGETRGHSVRNGLNAIADDTGVVAIHDGVRPLVSSKTIEQGFSLAEIGKNAVPSLEITDSLRVTGNEGNHPFDRSQVRRIQTPQCFPLHVMREAYQNPCFMNYTDDAQLIEKAGYEITLYEGNPENIKVTTPFDLKLARFLLADENFNAL